MQLFKWEWPGSKRKIRPQCRTGMARMGWRKAPGKYVGVKAHPLRPHDQRIKVNKRSKPTRWSFLSSSVVSHRYAQEKSCRQEPWREVQP